MAINNTVENINNQPTIEPRTVTGIFTKYIAKTLPLAFDESMSYYECLCALLEYLNEDIVPDINNVNNGLSELQTFYLQLQDYVNNYFDNLDVQEEINNKLDAMAEDGSLTTLIGAYVDPIQEQFENHIEEEISEIDDKVTSIASTSPLVATSTSEMTNINRIYVNTSDGYWYFYNGSAWTQGGVYQSSGISPNSINIYMLDNLLQNAFDIKYSKITAGEVTANSYYKYDGTLQTDSNYHITEYSLPINSLIHIYANNIGNVCGIVIKDSENNIIYKSSVGSSTISVEKDIYINQNGIKLYISSFASQNFGDFRVTKIDSISSLLNRTLHLLSELEDKFVRLNLNQTGQPVFIDDNNADVKVYTMTSGITYNISSFNFSAIAGIYITDSKGNVTYRSSDTNIGNNYEDVAYNFTSTEDGYIILTNYREHLSNITIYNPLIDELESNPLLNKKLGIDGDSIIAGNENSNVSFADIIATNNTMSKSKLAVGGATIATDTYSAGGNPRHYICTSVLNIDENSDYILINGGFNDYGNDVPLGTFTTSYTSDVDSSTFYGALETLCRNLLSRFTNKKIMFVIVHNINNTLFTENTINLTMTDYINAIYKVLNKYGIKIIDIGKNCHFNTALSYYKSQTINSDGVHPNTTAYNYFYVDYVTSIMKEI